MELYPQQPFVFATANPKSQNRLAIHGNENSEYRNSDCSRNPERCLVDDLERLSDAIESLLSDKPQRHPVRSASRFLSSTYELDGIQAEIFCSENPLGSAQV